MVERLELLEFVQGWSTQQVQLGLEQLLEEY